MLGRRAHEWGRAWRASYDPLKAISREVGSLSRDLGEYVLLLERTGTTFAAVAEVRADRPLSVQPEPLDSGRLHTMATVKVLLAFADAGSREAILRRMTFPRRGPNAPTSATALRRQIKGILKEEQVVCLDESDVGISAAAVPVRTPGGRVPAALGVSVPAVRFGADHREDLLGALRTTADRIARLWPEL